MERCFLHVCCAPCFAAARETLRQQGDAGLVGSIFFYNPNIHPLLEFRRRVKALRVYCERDPVSAEIDDRYGLREFLGAVGPTLTGEADRRSRCRACYRMRLGRTAEAARAAGYSLMSTTLLASREQDRELVAEAGREAAAQHGIGFAERDLRAFLPPEKMLRGIYKQQYCGCIFSEEERYRNTGKHLYGRGEDDAAGR